jgi:hypothetical protein
MSHKFYQLPQVNANRSKHVDFGAPNATLTLKPSIPIKNTVFILFSLFVNLSLTAAERSRSPALGRF